MPDGIDRSVYEAVFDCDGIPEEGSCTGTRFSQSHVCAYHEYFLQELAFGIQQRVNVL